MIKSFTGCQTNSLTPSCCSGNNCRRQEHKFNNGADLFSFWFTLCFFWKSVLEDGLTYPAPEEVYKSHSSGKIQSNNKIKIKVDNRFRRNGNTTPNSIFFFLREKNRMTISARKSSYSSNFAKWEVKFLVQFYKSLLDLSPWRPVFWITFKILVQENSHGAKTCPPK